MTEPQNTPGASANAEPNTRAESSNEMREIADHLRAVARLLLRKAAKDPAVRTVASEAQRLFHRFESSTEPFVKQLGQELDRLSSRFSESVHRSQTTPSSEARSPKAPSRSPEPRA